MREARADCDRDALLLVVEPEGPACHTGARTCFGDDTADARGRAGRAGARDRERARRRRPTSSYTARLLASGRDRILKKIGEEATEVVLAAKGESDERLAEEAADLLFHLLVALHQRGVPLARALEVLRRRREAPSEGARRFDEYERLSAGGGPVPVFREVPGDLWTPVSAFLALSARSERAFLLESVVGGERIARYSFLGRDPVRTVEARGAVRGRAPRAADARARRPLLPALREHLGPPAAEVPGLPRFTGGAVGYLSYDAVRLFERCPTGTRPPTRRSPRSRSTARSSPSTTCCSGSC